VIRVLFATTLVALIAGGMAWLLGAHDIPGIFWATATLVAILPAVWWVLAALRRGRVGADIIAVLALVGTLAIHEYVSGALIGVMLAIGQALEVAAERRAAKDLRSLLERAPALRVDGQRAGLQAVPVDEVASVMCSRWVPAKYFLWMRWSLRMGRLSTNRRSPVNPFTVITEGSNGAQWGGQCRWGRGDRATATADGSTYAGIVRMAQQAAAEGAPVVPLADRVAAWILPLALPVAAFARLISGSADRAMARPGSCDACPAWVSVVDPLSAQWPTSVARRLCRIASPNN